jgi:hypothetical protein
MLRNLKPWPRGGKIFLDPLVSLAFILRAPPPLQQHKTPITHTTSPLDTRRICIYLQARALVRIRILLFAEAHTHTPIAFSVYVFFQFILNTFLPIYQIQNGAASHIHTQAIEHHTYTYTESSALAILGLLNGGCECVFVMLHVIRE